MVSLYRPYASNICSILPLRIKSMALVKSTNNIVVSRFFARTSSSIRRIDKICDVMDLFLRKQFLVLPKYVLYVGFYAVAWQSIVYLGCCRCNGYTSVVLGKSMVAIFREGENTSLYPSVCWVWIIYSNTVSEHYVIELPGFPYFWGYFIKPCCFSLFNFYGNVSDGMEKIEKQSNP